MKWIIMTIVGAVLFVWSAIAIKTEHCIAGIFCGAALILPVFSGGLLFAAGIIGFSVALPEHHKPKNKTQLKWMVILKWILIIGGIALIVVSVYTANTYVDNSGEVYNVINGIAAFAGVVMFLGGLICWLLTPPEETVCKSR